MDLEHCKINKKVLLETEQKNIDYNCLLLFLVQFKVNEEIEHVLAIPTIPL